MKKFFTLAIAAIMSLGASAQLISSNTITQGEKTGYNRLDLSFNSISFGGDSDAWSGVTFDWTKGISVSSDMPMYIETGIGLTYGWMSESDGGYDLSGSFLAMKVPVNLTYKIGLGDSGFKVAPFAGIYFRGNFVGEQTVEYRGQEATYDFFEDADATRFNVGINFGAGVEYKKLYLGVSYAKDFNKFIDVEDGGSIGVFSATLGIVF